MLSYFTLSICSLYFPVRSAFCLTGNRNAVMVDMKTPSAACIWRCLFHVCQQI